MKFIGREEGFMNDFNNQKLFQKKQINVHYTDDDRGKTLSLGCDGIQFTIPFDELYKIINRRK